MWHGASLATLGRGQARRQPESTERWRRECRQSICDVRRFLMRPVACPALWGSIRRRCLEKLSTAHCSKTLDYLTAMARSPGGTGTAGAGLDVPSNQHPPNHVSPILGMDRGEKVNVLATCRGSPRGSLVPKKMLSSLQGQGHAGKWPPKSPTPPRWSTTSSLSGCECGRKPQPHSHGKKAAPRLGWDGSEPQSLAKCLPARRAGPALQRARWCRTMALALKQRGEGKQNLSIQLKAPGERQVGRNNYSNWNLG